MPCVATTAPVATPSAVLEPWSFATHLAARQRSKNAISERPGPTFSTAVVEAGKGVGWEGQQVLRADEVDGISGVYAVVHVVTGYRYTGCTKNMGKRFRQHETHLRTGLHNCRALQRLWAATTSAEWVLAVLSVGAQPLHADEAAAIRQAGDRALNPVRLLRLRPDRVEALALEKLAVASRRWCPKRPWQIARQAEAQG